MCATHLVSGTAESATPAFETLLVHLAVESHGLNQTGMFRLFCRAAGEYFGASGACCSFFSSQKGWIIGEVVGCQPWGSLGETLPTTAAECVELAQRTGKAVFCRLIRNEVPRQQEDCEQVEVAIPFLSHGRMLGAALLMWTGMTERLDVPPVEKLTLLGAFFSGLLDHTHLFDQVYRSRQQWVRVIDAIPSAIVVHNYIGNIVRINRPLADRVGAHPSKLIGRPIREVLGINGGVDAGICPLCSDSQEGIEGPVEIFANCSYLVSTTRMAGDLGADAQ